MMAPRFLSRGGFAQQEENLDFRIGTVPSALEARRTDQSRRRF
jgi:hypothetical protein